MTAVGPPPWATTTFPTNAIWSSWSVRAGRAKPNWRAKEFPARLFRTFSSRARLRENDRCDSGQVPSCVTNELGERLFDRMKREARLTPHGETFLRRAVKILEE